MGGTTICPELQTKNLGDARGLTLLTCNQSAGPTASYILNVSQIHHFSPVLQRTSGLKLPSNLDQCKVLTVSVPTHSVLLSNPSPDRGSDNVQTPGLPDLTSFLLTALLRVPLNSHSEDHSPPPGPPPAPASVHRVCTAFLTSPMPAGFQTSLPGSWPGGSHSLGCFLLLDCDSPLRK